MCSVSFFIDPFFYAANGSYCAYRLSSKETKQKPLFEEKDSLFPYTELGKLLPANDEDSNTFLLSTICAVWPISISASMRYFYEGICPVTSVTILDYGLYSNFSAVSVPPPCPSNNSIVSSSSITADSSISCIFFVDRMSFGRKS